MTVTTHEIGLEGIDGLAGVDSLCLFVGNDERPLKGTSGFVDWRLCGGLSRVLIKGFFKGEPDDWLLLPSQGRVPPIRIFVAGLGPTGTLTAQRLGSALAGAARTLTRAKVEAVAFEIPGAGALDDQARVTALSHHFLPGFKGSRVAILCDKGLGRLIPGR